MFIYFYKLSWQIFPSCILEKISDTSKQTKKSKLAALEVVDENPEDVFKGLQWDGAFQSDVSLKTLVSKLDKGIRRRKNLKVFHTDEEKQQVKLFKK